MTLTETSAPALTGPGSDEYAPFYAGYVARVGERDVLELLDAQLAEVPRFLLQVPAGLHEHRYQPGKWSIKEVVGHLADAERIMAYRALRIARGDATPLAGFDENAYVPAGNFGARPLGSLVSEWEDVRRATLSFLRHVDAEAARRVGTANGNPVSVRALAAIIAGHVEHHLDVLRTRYLR